MFSIFSFNYHYIVLNLIIFQFYKHQLVDQETYLLSPSGNYFVPEWGKWQNFVDYIKDLPLIPHPEVKKNKTFNVKAI